jgi:transcriptional regulator with XRE-family HTH domain
MTPNDLARDQVVVGGALRRLRERRAIQEAELASTLEIEVAYVVEIEQGGMDVRWQTVMRFLRALDATLAELAAEIENTHG